MYWQKQFEKENKDQAIENEIKKIFEENDKNYGYRRITGELRERVILLTIRKFRESCVN